MNLLNFHANTNGPVLAVTGEARVTKFQAVDLAGYRPVAQEPYQVGGAYAVVDEDNGCTSDQRSRKWWLSGPVVKARTGTPVACSMSRR